jgi:AbrB family looped-hinge helix DNA binding protein
MPTATVSSKGQVTLPKEVRDFLNVGAGDRLEFAIEPNRTVRVRRLGKSILDLAGMLHRPGMKPMTVREMDEAIAEYHAEEDERIRRGGR